MSPFEELNREREGKVDDAEIAAANLVKQAPDSADDKEHAPREKYKGSNIEVLIKGNVEKVGDTQSEIVEGESKPITSHEEETTKDTGEHNYEKEGLGLSWAKLRMSFRFLEFV